MLAVPGALNAPVFNSDRRLDWPMPTDDTAALRAAIAALESQRATLGDAVLELATAPLRARLVALLRPAGLLGHQGGDRV